VTSRAALRNFRQLRIAYWADTPDTPEVREALNQTGALASEVSHAVAIVEPLGSDETRKCAREIYAKARVCADLFQARSMSLAMTQTTATRKTPGQFDKYRQIDAPKRPEKKASPEVRPGIEPGLRAGG
jgi:hypothetical protein